MSEGVVFDEVSRTFGAHRALERVSFTCVPGEVTCLVGPNGAGKSTALSLAAGLLAPGAGTITVGGANADELSARVATGYLPQRSAFPDALTVEEVVGFSCAARGLDVAATEDLLAATGLDAVLRRRIGELSGGWARRLGIHIALLPRTTVVLLDEPFVGLDPDTLDQVVAHLKERVRSGTTAVVSTHDFDVIDELEPNLLVLANGRLVGAARPDDQDARATYRRLLTQSEPAS